MHAPNLHPPFISPPQLPASLPSQVLEISCCVEQTRNAYHHVSNPFHLPPSFSCCCFSHQWWSQFHLLLSCYWCLRGVEMHSLPRPQVRPRRPPALGVRPPHAVVPLHPKGPLLLLSANTRCLTPLPPHLLPLPRPLHLPRPRWPPLHPP